MNNVNVTSVRGRTHIKIYIDGSLHLAFNLFRVRVHSWYDPAVNTTDEFVIWPEKFFIEIRSAGDTIKCEYDNKALWLAVLVELDKVIT